VKSFEAASLGLALSAVLSACSPGNGDAPTSPAAGPSPAPASPPPSPGPTTPPTASTIDPVSGFQTTPPPNHTTVSDGANLILLADGTTATSFNITVNGKSRRYVVLRQITPQANAPMLLMLHPSGTSPETMANLTNVSDYVLTQGFITVLPEALNGSWDDDPSQVAQDDVPFLTTLIDTLIAHGGYDATRVYATGFSSGGFMAERLACDVSDRIAAFGIDSATLRSTQVAACAATVQRPKVYFLGTADLIVPYGGIFGNQANGLMGADGTLAYWAGRQQCGGAIAANLPNLANDGTTVTQTQYTGCTGGTALQLYTINNGGHEWPGGDPTLFGVTTMDIAATGLVWQFVSGYRR